MRASPPVPSVWMLTGSPVPLPRVPGYIASVSLCQQGQACVSRSHVAGLGSPMGFSDTQRLFPVGAPMVKTVSQASLSTATGSIESRYLDSQSDSRATLDPNSPRGSDGTLPLSSPRDSETTIDPRELQQPLPVVVGSSSLTEEQLNEVRLLFEEVRDLRLQVNELKEAFLNRMYRYGKVGFSCSKRASGREVRR